MRFALASGADLGYNDETPRKGERDMRICGLQKMSMVDYPGKLAATVFTGGCNLRCPFCHNAGLVTHLQDSPQLEREEILRFLRSRRGLLDAVVLSGGEPLLQRGAADFLAEVRQLGYLVKLDTNGCYPRELREILDRGLVDYVAMDIKNCPEKYPATVGVPGFDPAVIMESFLILKESGVDFELRTTVSREFHTAQDIAAIGRWLGGVDNYYLQNFEDSGDVICGGLHGFTKEEMELLARQARPWAKNAGIRGF